MTEITSLGEFALIEHITKEFPLLNKSTLKGVGDDCAVIGYAPNQRVVVTSDLLLEGIHFDLTYVPLKHLGYKAAVVNISDVVAMNARPRQLVIALGLSKRFSVEAVEEIYAGIRLACDVYGVDLVGGDTTASLTGLTISGTCLGEASDEELAYRSGAKATDLICVSGNLGAAYMGLQLLEREKAVFADVSDPADFAPAFEGREYLLERQLKPEARLDIIRALAEKNIKPTSMIDISDGLSSELLHISKQSGVGVRIYEDRLPIDHQTAFMAEELGIGETTAALNGGEDYELLFTVPLGVHDLIRDLPDIHLIGHVTEENLGSCLIARDGTEIPLQAQGWTSFAQDTQDHKQDDEA